MNVSVQKGLPWNSALTVSYVGVATARPGVAVPVQRGGARGATPTCRRPSRIRRSARSTCSRIAESANYNALQIKWERRFADGMSFSGSYSLAKDTSDTVASDETGRIQPFTPDGYLSGRGRRTTGGTCCGSTPSTSCRSAVTGVSSTLCIRWRSLPRRLAAEWHQQLRLGRTAQHQRPRRDARQRLGHARQRDGRSRRVRPVGDTVVQHRGVLVARAVRGTATRRLAWSKVRRRTSSTSD